MRVQIKELQYWKTEHTKEGCQDAYKLEASKGLFAVADGAGTTLFPAIWARILVEHFLKVPLMSVDHYEVEWWARQAQEVYKTRIPSMAQLRDWSIQQKALSQSSDSTLATVRIVASDASSAQAKLLVFGDSCVIIGNRETKQIRSFVLDDAAQFAQPPVCIPSLLKVFNRDFHTGSIKNETLGPEHIVIIASDAVSKWIVGGGGGHFTDNEHESKAWQAFQAVYTCTGETWPAFIDACREAKEMVNDDCTALILDLKTDDAGEGLPLGRTSEQFPEVIQQRQAAFENARREGNNELVAISYGDGTDLKGRVPDVTDEEIVHAREVADALKEVLRAFRQFQGTPGLATKMQPIWDRYRSTLLTEKCAENIRETLQRNGVRLLTPPPPEPVQLPAPSANSTATTDYGPQQSTGQTLPAQRQREFVALQTQNAKKDKAIIAFLTAYGESHTTNNDEVLLIAAKELTNIVPDHQFTEAQKKKIAEAQSRLQALERLREAFRDGNIAKIVAVARSLPVEAQVQLTADELNRIPLAYQMKAAFDKDDDAKILATGEELARPEKQGFFRFTESERERIKLAQKRQEALNKLRPALQAGSLQTIRKNYDPILDGSQQLTQEERSLLQLSREFVEAFDASDDFALAEAYRKIEQSPHYDQISFTARERSRIEQAKQQVQAWLALSKEPVAQVKGQNITLQQIRKAGIFRKAINEYWIKQYRQELTALPDEASRQEKSKAIAEAQQYIDPRRLASHVLDELAIDLLIQQELKESGGESDFQNEYDVKNRALRHLTHFRTEVVSDYLAFLKQNRLNEEDLVSLCEMSIRPQDFKLFFERQQQHKWEQQRIKLGKPKSFEAWLEDQRKGVTYKYPSDSKQRALWMAEQLGWIE